MPVIQFRGFVYPAIAQINTAKLDLLWPEPDKGSPMLFVLKTTNNIVTADCTLRAYDPQAMLSVEHFRALELARALTDSLAFEHAIGLTVVSNEVISPAGVRRPMLARNAELEKIVTAFGPTSSDRDTVTRLIISDPGLFVTMNELSVAVAIPGLVAINCGRALDGIRQMMLPNDPGRKQGWIRVQTELNIDEKYRQFVMETSTGPRHAVRDDIATATNQEVLVRTWSIMNRFLEYRKRGNKRLQPPDFLLLC